MRCIPEATEITLTVEERQQLEALVRSAKCEARMRFRAWIVLLAAAGIGTREISRRLRCTIGTASKWRVRYARDRLAGLSEVGDRGAEAKYGTEHQQRIWRSTATCGLRQLDGPAAGARTRRQSWAVYLAGAVLNPPHRHLQANRVPWRESHLSRAPQAQSRNRFK